MSDLIKVFFNCNLDISIHEEWPGHMPCVPGIGHIIRSVKIWPTNFQLNLEVYSVNWIYNNNRNVKFNPGWYPHIELYIPKHRPLSIKEFNDWYAECTK